MEEIDSLLDTTDPGVNRIGRASPKFAQRIKSDVKSPTKARMQDGLLKFRSASLFSHTAQKLDF